MRGENNKITQGLLDLFYNLDSEIQKELMFLYENKKTEIIKLAEGETDENMLFCIFLSELVITEFKWFVLLFIQLVEGQNFDFALHAKILCEVCQQHSKNNLKYDAETVINIPPGHSKTVICNIMYTAWLLGRDPTMRIIVRTTTDDMAVETNIKTAAIMTSQAFVEVFGNIIGHWTNYEIRTYRGSIFGYRSSGAIGARVTGKNAELVVIDDPNDSQRKDGAVYEEVINSYFSGLATRNRGTDNSLNNLIIQQRVSRMDLSGEILRRAEQTQKPVNHIIIRAFEEEPSSIQIECKDYLRTFDRPEGYLWYPKSEKMLKNRMNLYAQMKAIPYIWASQYQQDPSDTGLSIVPWDYFEFYEEDVKELQLKCTFITCDIAFTDNKTSDRTCVCCWGLDSKSNVYLIDILFDRYKPEDLPKLLIDFYNKNKVTEIISLNKDSYGRRKIELAHCYAFFIEKVHNEILIPLIQQDIQCLHELKRTLSKAGRIEQALPVLAQHVVYLPKNRFFREMSIAKEELREITAETLGVVHDDFLDNTADCINEGRNTQMIPRNLIYMNTPRFF